MFKNSSFLIQFDKKFFKIFCQNWFNKVEFSDKYEKKSENETCPKIRRIWLFFFDVLLVQIFDTFWNEICETNIQFLRQKSNFLKYVQN